MKLSNNLSRVLLAGVSDANDDYWQGEQVRWLETYQGGKDALSIRNLKFDESALAWEIQILWHQI
jgi:hypothetical protein